MGDGLLPPTVGALLSFVTAFFNFIPLWISLSRAPLSVFFPPFDGAGAAGGGGGPGGGGGGGGMVSSLFYLTLNFAKVSNFVISRTKTKVDSICI